MNRLIVTLTYEGEAGDRIVLERRTPLDSGGFTGHDSVREAREFTESILDSYSRLVTGQNARATDRRLTDGFRARSTAGSQSGT